VDEYIEIKRSFVELSRMKVFSVLLMNQLDEEEEEVFHYRIYYIRNYTFLGLGYGPSCSCSNACSFLTYESVIRFVSSDIFSLVSNKIIVKLIRHLHISLQIRTE
jgi:hypothetical protein